MALAATPLTGAHLAELHALVAGGRLSATAAKEVLAGVLGGGGRARAGGRPGATSSRSPTTPCSPPPWPRCSPPIPPRWRACGRGEERLVGFLVGKVMQATGGKADPRRVSEAIRRAAG